MDAPRPIRAAATVIVTAPDQSECSQGYEVFTVKRSHGSGFMAGAHVFPGGVVDPIDHEPWWLEDGDSKPPEDSPYRVAAIRELFEETGILLVDPPEAADTLSAEQIQRHREAVHDDAQEFPRLCKQMGCKPAINQMLPWSRWITPPQEKRRFDARFYVALLPVAPPARHDDHETISSCWITPDEALQSAEAGEIFLPPPTWFTFRELRALPSQEHLKNELSGGRSVEPIEPHILPGKGELILAMQGDRDHPVSPGDGQNRIILKDGQYTLSSTNAPAEES